MKNYFENLEEAKVIHSNLYIHNFITTNRYSNFEEDCFVENFMMNGYNNSLSITLIVFEKSGIGTKYLL